MLTRLSVARRQPVFFAVIDERRASSFISVAQARTRSFRLEVYACVKPMWPDICAVAVIVESWDCGDVLLARTVFAHSEKPFLVFAHRSLVHNDDLFADIICPMPQVRASL